MKVFATDVDSVLLDITTPMVNHFARRYPGREVYPQAVQHWSLETSYGVTAAEVEEMWDYAFAEATPEEPGATEFISELKKKGFRVVAVTARIPRFQKRLLDDVAHMGLDDVIFARDKEETLRSLSAVGFVDDKIAHTHEAHRAGVEKVFLYDQPWNWSFDLNVPYTRAFDHWSILAGLE